MTAIPPPLLTVKAALVLLLAILVGLGATVLALLGGSDVPSALLVGGGASGFTLLAAHSLIG